MFHVVPSRVQIKAVPYRCEDWSSRERLAILAMCNKLSATIGGCERLVQTPVPLHYVRHTSRFLTIWCLLLPLVIGESSWFICLFVYLFIYVGLFLKNSVLKKRKNITKPKTQQNVATLETNPTLWAPNDDSVCAIM